MNARAEPAVLGHPTVWTALAPQWRAIDAPLRPGEDDVAVYEELMRQWQRAHPGRAARGLLLGVTAEIASMAWPEGASFVAVDHSLPMVANVWPRPAHGSPVCADWRAMPLPSGSRDVALGDGCLTLLPVPRGRQRFAENLRRVLVDDGVLALRCFCRPGKPEPTARVFDDLRAGRIRGFHAFKWRLAMSLHAEVEEGVRLGDVWERWRAEVADPDALARSLGWPLAAVRSMQVYRGSDARYLFSTEEEIRAGLAPWFTLESQHAGRYELAERCPILVFRPA